ncbi:unnamed protein product [Calypogeia fissa]
MNLSNPAGRTPGWADQTGFYSSSRPSCQHGDALSRRQVFPSTGKGSLLHGFPRTAVGPRDSLFSNVVDFLSNVVVHPERSTAEEGGRRENIKNSPETLKEIGQGCNYGLGWSSHGTEEPEPGGASEVMSWYCCKGEPSASDLGQCGARQSPKDTVPCEVCALPEYLYSLTDKASRVGSNFQGTDRPTGSGGPGPLFAVGPLFAQNEDIYLYLSRAGTTSVLSRFC